MDNIFVSGYGFGGSAEEEIVLIYGVEGGRVPKRDRK